MTKPMNRDMKVIKTCVKALLNSSSLRMLRANIDYLHDRFRLHPNATDLEHIRQNAQSDRKPEGE